MKIQGPGGVPDLVHDHTHSVEVDIVTEVAVLEVRHQNLVHIEKAEKEVEVTVVMKKENIWIKGNCTDHHLMFLPYQ